MRAGSEQQNEIENSVLSPLEAAPFARNLWLLDKGRAQGPGIRKTPEEERRCDERRQYCCWPQGRCSLSV